MGYNDAIRRSQAEAKKRMAEMKRKQEAAVRDAERRRQQAAADSKRRMDEQRRERERRQAEQRRQYERQEAERRQRQERASQESRRRFDDDRKRQERQMRDSRERERRDAEARERAREIEKERSAQQRWREEDRRDRERDRQTAERLHREMIAVEKRRFSIEPNQTDQIYRPPPSEYSNTRDAYDGEVSYRGRSRWPLRLIIALPLLFLVFHFQLIRPIAAWTRPAPYFLPADHIVRSLSSRLHYGFRKSEYPPCSAIVVDHCQEGR